MFALLAMAGDLGGSIGPESLEELLKWQEIISELE